MVGTNGHSHQQWLELIFFTFCVGVKIMSRWEFAQNTVQGLFSTALSHLFIHLQGFVDRLLWAHLKVTMSGEGREGNVQGSMLLLLLSHFSRVQLCATPWMAAHQAPLSLGFSRQERWSGLPFPLQCMKVESESEVAQSCGIIQFQRRKGSWNKSSPTF